MTKYISDKDALRMTFEALRYKGYWARTNEPTGWAGIPDDVRRRGNRMAMTDAVEMAASFDKKDNLVAMLPVHCFSHDVHEVATELRSYGFCAKILGVPGEERIEVTERENKFAGSVAFDAPYKMRIPPLTVQVEHKAEGPDVTLSTGAFGGITMKMSALTFRSMVSKGALAPQRNGEQA